MPDRQARVDLRHPLTAGLGMMGLQNTVTYPAWTAATDGGVTPSAYGSAWAGAASTGIAGCPLPAQTDTTSFTMAAVAEAKASTSRYYVGFRTHQTGGAYCAVENNGSTVFWRYQSASSVRTISATSAAGSHVYVAVKDGLTLSLYDNAALVASATYTTGQLALNASTIYHGTDYSAVTAVVASWCWPGRALSHNEITALRADPFGMLRVG